MKNIKLIMSINLILIVLILLAINCHLSEPEDAYLSGFLDGKVYNYVGLPLKDAIVSINKDTYTTTDSEGKYKFNNIYGRVDLTFTEKTHIAYTISGINKSNFSITLGRSDYISPPSGNVELTLQLSSSVSEPSGINFDLYLTDGHYASVNISSGSSSAIYTFTNVSIYGAKSAYCKQRMSDGHTQRFGIERGFLIKENLTTSVTIKIKDAIETTLTGRINTPAFSSKVYIWPLLNIGYEGKISIGYSKLFDPGDFSLYAVSTPIGNRYDIYASSYDKDGNGAMTWTFDHLPGDANILIPDFIDKIPIANVEILGNSPTFKWEKASNTHLYKINLLSKSQSGNDYVVIWYAYTQGDIVSYPKLPVSASSVFNLKSGNTYKYEIIGYNMPGVDINTNFDWEYLKGTCWTTRKDLIIP